MTDKVEASRWIPFALLALEAPLGIWCVYSLLGGGGPQSVAFDAAAGSFVILAMAYLGLHGFRGMAWTSIPVLLTIEALLGFIGIPGWQIAIGELPLDGSYVRAMSLVLIGFACFWLGSAVLVNERGVQFVPKTQETSKHVILISAGMLGLGVAGNAVLWRTGLFAYGADEASLASSAGIVQWMNLLAEMLLYALVVSAIEVFGKRSVKPLTKSIFWIALLLSVGFGAISGMKSGPLFPLLYVALIYGITRRRMPRTALLLPIFLIVLIYPFVNAFRNNLNSGYRAQFNTMGGLEETLVQSYDDAFRSIGSSTSEAREQSFQETTSRLSYLTYVRDVSELPVPSMLNGDEKVWMAPLYPFIPRFLWPEKPTLNKGHRLSVLLGIGSQSSTALTPIGDLYAMYGTYGVAAGMLVWGACLQLCMNWIGSRAVTEKGLFIFMLMLPSVLNLEVDFSGLIAAAVQRLMVALLISYIIYGRSKASARAFNHLRHFPERRTRVSDASSAS